MVIHQADILTDTACQLSHPPFTGSSGDITLIWTDAYLLHFLLGANINMFPLLI